MNDKKEAHEKQAVVPERRGIISDSVFGFIDRLSINADLKAAIKKELQDRGIRSARHMIALYRGNLRPVLNEILKKVDPDLDVQKVLQAVREDASKTRKKTKPS